MKKKKKKTRVRHKEKKQNMSLVSERVRFGESSKESERIVGGSAHRPGFNEEPVASKKRGISAERPAKALTPKTS
jgi:hypothetical protein